METGLGTEYGTNNHLQSEPAQNARRHLQHA